MRKLAQDREVRTNACCLKARSFARLILLISRLRGWVAGLVYKATSVGRLGEGEGSGNSGDGDWEWEGIRRLRMRANCGAEGWEEAIWVRRGGRSEFGCGGWWRKSSCSWQKAKGIKDFLRGSRFWVIS